MEDLRVISSTIIRPGNINQPGRAKIHLTPFDLNLLYLDYLHTALIFPKPDPETWFINRLKTSFSTTLDHFFPFAGRLVKVNNLEDKTVSFHIECDNTSRAKFIHAKAESVTVSDLLGSNSSSFLSFFPLNGVKSIDGVFEPLLAIQVTEIKDGVIIGFCYNHMVADGVSIWNFINLWSKICLTGHVENLKPLTLQGWYLNRINYPVWIPVSETEIELNRNISNSPSIERILHFTKKNISDLKAKVNKEIEMSSNDVQISSLQALIAYLWRRIAKHSRLNREEEMCCNVAVDMRQRLNPPLEKECFGNAANMVIAKAKVGELMDNDLGWIGLLINQSVKSATDLNFKNYAENWVKNVKIPKFNGNSRIFSNNSLTFGNSPWFDWYGNDFGFGKPVAVRVGPGNEIGGRLTVFRGIEEGSIDIHATLASSLWSDSLLNLLEDVESM